MNLSGQNVLFLHGRLAGYFDACMKHFANSTGAQVHVLRKSGDKLVPFEIKQDAKVKYYDRDQFDHNSIRELIEKLNPSAVCVAGWKDKDYLKGIKALKKKNDRPVIGIMDNQWKGTRNQKLGTILSPWLIKPYFTHLWVPGMYQYEFARRLGFDRNQILTGLYCADLEKFTFEESRTGSIPHRFLFVGRLVQIKAIDVLVEAMKDLNERVKHDWEFWIIGRGPMGEIIPDLPNIRNMDFMQPSALAEIAREGGVFILPSYSDAWGVVVHEFAAAGFPLLVSDAVGARAAFVKEGYNGYVFPTGNARALSQALQNYVETDEAELNEMGKRSQILAKCINPDIWSHTLANVIHSYGRSTSTHLVDSNRLVRAGL